MTFYREIEEHRLTVFLGANKYTSFNIQIIQIFLDAKISKDNYYDNSVTSYNTDNAIFNFSSNILTDH